MITVDKTSSLKVRSSVEVLKVIYWYESINWLGGFRSAYQMETYFEPINDLASQTNFRNKWNRYKNGKHTPKSKVIDLVDKKISIPKKILNHYLWGLLDKSENTINGLEDDLLKLDPYISHIVYGFSPLGSRKLKSFHKIDMGQLFLIMSEMPLDVIATLYIYWQYNQCSNKICNRLAQECSEHIYYALLVMGTLTHYCSTSRVIGLLYEWFEENVFLKTDWGNKIYSMNKDIFIQNIDLLHGLMAINPNKNRHGYSKSLPVHSQNAFIILSEGIVDRERNNLCRLIRRGRKGSDRLDSDLIQSFYLSSDCHLGLRILFMDKDGEYHNQTYAHWLLLNLSIVGKFVNTWRWSSELGTE